jgi:hypothetical protein
MKVPALIIVAGATLALAAPGGYAANTRLAPEPGPAAKSQSSSHALSVSLKKKPTKKPGGKILSNKGGKGSKVRPLPPIIIVRVWPSQAQTQTSSVDNCQAYMVDCTAQQECEIWGSNCNLVQNPAPQAAPGDSSGSDASGNVSATVESSSSDSTAAAASVESSASDSSTSTDASLANLIEENCGY